MAFQQMLGSKALWRKKQKKCVHGMCGSKVGVERGGGINRFLVGEIQICLSDRDNSVQLQTASTPSEKPIIVRSTLSLGRVHLVSRTCPPCL